MNDLERRRLAALAERFVVDPESEAALVARARDPEAYDRELARVGVDTMSLSLYAVGREAAIQIGAFKPPAPTERKS
jgi:hypothetical protein